MRRFAVGIAALAFISFIPPAAAQDQPVRVRGTVERVDEGLYIIKARNGSELKVKLADNAMVVALVKASLADVKQGSYIGVSGMIVVEKGVKPQANQMVHPVAVEVVVKLVHDIVRGRDVLQFAQHAMPAVSDGVLE